MPFLFFIRFFKAFCFLLLSLSGTVLLAQQEAVPSEYASLEAELAPRALPLAIRTESGAVPERRFNREWLAERGLAFTFSYTAEAFTNVRRDGNSRRGTEYLGSVDTTLEFDFGELGLGRGQLVVSAQGIHGRSINDSRVGAIQSPSNLDSAGFNKFTEVWYGDSYLEDRIRIKIGRQYADADFNVTESASEFLNSSYGLIPTVLSPTYPTPMLGASAWTEPAKWIAMGVGVYRGGELEPVDGTAPPAKQGLFSMAEVKLKPYSSNSAFHGVYSVGVWLQPRGAWSTSTETRTVRNGGVYATADHWFRRTNSAGENSGPGVFLQAGWAPADRNEITGYISGGLAWRGLIPTRSNDSVGLGVTQVKLSATGRETATEIYYRWQVSKKLALQPDLQFVSRPYGTGRNAVVAGIRTVFEI
jgi:porin